jgi:sodium transport system ATP-binding protein
VEKLCDRVCIINEGATAFMGTPGQLRARAASGDIVDAFVGVITKEA